MNHTVGKVGAAVTGLAVLCFAVSMIFGFFADTLFTSCLASMFIALGYVLFAGALAASNNLRNCHYRKRMTSPLRAKSQERFDTYLLSPETLQA